MSYLMINAYKIINFDTSFISTKKEIRIFIKIIKLKMRMNFSDSQIKQMISLILNYNNF